MINKSEGLISTEVKYKLQIKFWIKLTLIIETKNWMQ